MKIQIFKTGKHTDSAGIEREWTSADLDKIAASYNPSTHEAPVVIGHPKDNAPAYGWVEKVWREGETLWAGLKDLVPEFVDLVKQGLFKKRSISLYPDLTLRHVGFLGAMPPAVKGLADVAFEAGEACIEFSVQGSEFSNEHPNDINKNSKSGESRKEGKMTFKEWVTQLKKMFLDLPEDIPGGTAVPQVFSEAEVQAQVEAARKKAEEEANAKKDAEFAEKARLAKQEGLRAAISSWCEAMVDQGKLTPAWVKFGLPDLLFAAGQIGTEIEFGEEKTKAEPLARWKEFFEKQLPAVVSFKEIASREKDTGQGSAGEKLTALTHAEMEKDKTLTFGEAFKKVQIANIDLAREYAAEIRE